jgi:hypothetical protein
MDDQQRTEFEQAGEKQAQDNVLADFWYLFRHSRKWWLLPIVVVVLLLGALMLLSGTAVAPFIYTLF